VIVVDRNPGDYLVVMENGAETCVELGAILGSRTRSGKTSVPDGARASCLVTTLDRESLFPLKGTWRAIAASTEVVAVIATKPWLREMRSGGRASRHDAMRDVEVDPLAAPRPRGF
jgi:hypothetical protein